MKKTRLAVIHKDGECSAISGVGNHVGGPLGESIMEGGYVVCPWHFWKFHFQTGHGEPGYEEARVPAYTAKVENDRGLVDMSSGTKRHQKKHPPHPWARRAVREEGVIRVGGQVPEQGLIRGGRKGHELDVRARI